jgi:pyruvate/2-oxoglutarate dehydrogenase complex dihydrolipoamide dehydrogenase (E3) component
VLVSTVELFTRARAAAPLGLSGTDALRLDWSAVVARKRAIVESLSQGAQESLEKLGITTLEGDARFIGPREVEVKGKRLTAGKFVIATGSSPARPSVPGAEHLLTSDGLLDLERLPARLVVLGGGVIGMELGFCLARAGSRVTVVHRGAQILPSLDETIREHLLEIGRGIGIEFVTGATVRAIRADRTVEAEVAGASRAFPADVVLAATGRPPNTAALALDAAGVATARGSVVVNEHLRSVSNPDVLAAGDVSGGRQHSPVAWYEGAIAGHNAVRGDELRTDYSVLPTAIFTIPSSGQVGLTESQAREEGLAFKVATLPFTHNPAAKIRAEEEGIVKVISEGGTSRLLGVHVLGPGAEDLIQIAAVAIRGGLTRKDLAGMHYVFPTLGGAIFDVMWD